MKGKIRFPTKNGHKCFLCSRTFASKFSCLRHFQVVHCGVKSYICDCGKLFASREHLQAHTTSKHTKEKPYICEKGCSKSFASHSARYYHYKMHHDLVRFRCQYVGCSKEVSSLKHLRTHISKDHCVYTKTEEPFCMLEEDLFYLYSDTN